jgi:hypothetical protein
VRVQSRSRLTGSAQQCPEVGREKKGSDEQPSRECAHVASRAERKSRRELNLYPQAMTAATPAASFLAFHAEAANSSIL